MKLAPALFTVAAAIAAPSALAAETPSADGHTGFVLQGAYEFGGETVVSCAGCGSAHELRAGEGINVAAGVYHLLANSPVSLRGTVGFKFAGVDINGTKFTLARIPLEFIGSYHFANDARVGGGLVIHTANTLASDGPFPDVKFKTAGGLELEAGYKLILATVTLMNYKDEFGNKYKANSVGLRLVFEFGAPWLS